MNDATVLGIDWHKRGWVGVLLSGKKPPAVLVDPDLAAMVAAYPDASCVAIDMPIGLPAGLRAADSQARIFVKGRRNSVFMTPPKEVLLTAMSYAEANVIAPALTGGKKITQQAWALRHNIDIVATVAEQDVRLIEVHPEVSFCAMNGSDLAYAKTTWNGLHLRRQLLAEAGIEIPDHLAAAGGVSPVDILDAAAASWSARRYAADAAQSFPPSAAPGQREVIWY